jgi:hypothetical protein
MKVAPRVSRPFWMEALFVFILIMKSDAQGEYTIQHSFQRAGEGESPVRVNLWNGLASGSLKTRVGLHGVPPLKG